MRHFIHPQKLSELEGRKLPRCLFDSFYLLSDDEPVCEFGTMVLIWKIFRKIWLQ